MLFCGLVLLSREARGGWIGRDICMYCVQTAGQRMAPACPGATKNLAEGSVLGAQSVANALPMADEGSGKP